MKIFTWKKQINSSDHKTIESLFTSQKYTLNLSPPNPINAVFIEYQDNSFFRKEFLQMIPEGPALNSLCKTSSVNLEKS